jgi:hypothetical protein
LWVEVCDTGETEVGVWGFEVGFDEEIEDAIWIEVEVADQGEDLVPDGRVGVRGEECGE